MMSPRMGIRYSIPDRNDPYLALFLIHPSFNGGTAGLRLGWERRRHMGTRRPQGQRGVPYRLAQGRLLKEQRPGRLHGPGRDPEHTRGCLDSRCVHLADDYSPKPSGMLTPSSLTRKAHLSVASSMRI